MHHNVSKVIVAAIAIMGKHSKLQALCAKIVELYPSQAWG